MLVNIGPSPPLPFESSWMLFVKATAFNLINPKDLFRVLSHDKLFQSGVPRYWLSDWLNLAEFSQAVRLPTWIVRQSFVDQICTAFNVDKNIIRHCPECIELGYHSTLFQFALITHCPWHGRLLTPCTVCSNAFRMGGIRIKPVEMISRMGFSYEVSLPCGHFRFHSDGAMISQNSKKLPLDVIQKRCIDCILWLRWSSSLGSAGLFTCMGFFEDTPPRITKLFDACLDHVESLIGQCPWRPKHPYSKLRSRLPAFRTSRVGCTVPGRIFDGDPLTLFKSIRRYLYKEHVRHHKRCWNEISHLDPPKLHALDVNGACSASSAYLAWLMSLQWDANTGKGQYAHINLIQLKRNQCPIDAANVGLLWLLHFYTIWAGIERGCDDCQLHRDRFTVEMCSSAPPLTLGEDCILCYGEEGVISGLYPSPTELGSMCNRRCLRRPNKSAFVNEQATWSIYHWGYEAKQNVLLRFWRGSHSKRGGLHSTVIAG
jgi:hypothetical protein